MTLTAAIYIGLRVMGGAITFVLCSLWLEVNSAGDRVIQRLIRTVGAFASHALDSFVGWTM